MDDPFQLKNLSENPKFKKVLAEMRRQQDDWTLKTGDMGHLNEPEMIEQMWPGGKQPVTDTPYFIVNAPEDRGSKNYSSGGTFSWPMTLSFYCPTHGASLVYTFDEGPKAFWKLYSGPLTLEKGNHKIRVKAVRYGYKESNELNGIFEIKHP
jgi:hypothetical protein